MGFVSDVVGGIFGSGADAAQDAAGVQAASANQAIAAQTKARNQARKDLEPFRKVGATDLADLGRLVTDPKAQAQFISNNPFFDALAERSTSTLMNNAAAKGKVGSGGTAEALQNSLILLGSDLLNQNITQRQNLAALGSNAAAGQATATQNAGTAIADLATQSGNAQAAGIIGARNAQTQAVNNVANTAAMFALSDRRAKEDIKQVGTLHNGLPVYLFRYKGDDEPRMNVMAQDVEKVMPEAIIERGGLKYVNMEMVWQ